MTLIPLEDIYTLVDTFVVYSAVLHASLVVFFVKSYVNSSNKRNSVCLESAEVLYQEVQNC